MNKEFNLESLDKVFKLLSNELNSDTDKKTLEAYINAYKDLDRESDLWIRKYERAKDSASIMQAKKQLSGIEKRKDGILTILELLHNKAAIQNIAHQTTKYDIRYGE